jgi:hypothetical protein
MMIFEGESVNIVRLHMGLTYNKLLIINSYYMFRLHAAIMR